METDILVVVYVPPVPIEAPPVAAVYHLMVPAEDVAAKVTEPGPHRAAGVVPVMVGISLTVPVTAVLEAVVQLPAVAST